MIDLVTLLLSLLALRLAIYLLLECINLQFLKLNGLELPDSIKGIMDEPTFSKSVEYTKAKSNFFSVSTIYEGLILALIILLGILPYIYNSLSAFFGYGLLGQSLVFLVTLFIFGLPNAPLIGGKHLS